jgi:DNA gyrase inhibitor GyrI
VRSGALIWLAVGVLAAGAGALATKRALAVEAAPYSVEMSDGAFQIRRYPEQVVAEVERPGSREAAANSAFRALFNYISGKGRSGDKIAMTAPVTQNAEPIAMSAPVAQAQSQEGVWTVAFVMPAGSTIETLPTPAGDDVRLEVRPAQRVAAIRFSGRWTDANFADKTAELTRWMNARDLSPAGPPTYAFYNPPFTPWFMRHNEILIPIGD